MILHFNIPFYAVFNDQNALICQSIFANEKTSLSVSLISKPQAPLSQNWLIQLFNTCDININIIFGHIIMVKLFVQPQSHRQAVV